MREERARTLTDDEKLHIKLARELRPMIASDGWKAYTKILREHLAQKEKDALRPSKGVDDAVEQNAAKGAVLALRLALDIPSGIISVADEIRTPASDEDVL